MTFHLYKSTRRQNFEPEKNLFSKNINKLDLKKYELDRLRCLNDNLVESVGADSYYIIPDNKKNNSNFLTKKKSLKTTIYIFLIQLIYFFKRA